MIICVLVDFFHMIKYQNVIIAFFLRRIIAYIQYIAHFFAIEGAGPLPGIISIIDPAINQSEFLFYITSGYNLYWYNYRYQSVWSGYRKVTSTRFWTSCFVLIILLLFFFFLNKVSQSILSINHETKFLYYILHCSKYYPSRRKPQEIKCSCFVLLSLSVLDSIYVGK